MDKPRVARLQEGDKSVAFKSDIRNRNCSTAALAPPSNSLRHRAVVGIIALALVLAAQPLIALAAPRGASGDALGGEGRVPDRVVAQFASGVADHARAQARRGVGGDLITTIEALAVEVWRVPEHAADRALTVLQHNPHVTAAKLDAVVELTEVTPNDPWYPNQWGMKKVELPTAWTVTKGASSTNIAILDTGVNGVPDLKNKLVQGGNVLNNTNHTTDNHGHGTLVAGVAGAETDNGLDVAGSCWECRLMPVKIMDSGGGFMSDLAKGIVWAVDNGADVISMSVSGANGTNAVRNAVGYASDRDVVLLAAAGNQGETAKRYPPAYAEVIAVAGTTSDDQLYSWSNYGSWVDVAAPGANRSTNKDGGVSLFGGTSSATPAAAGVAATGLATGASADQVRNAQQDSALPLSEIKFGRIDAAALLDRLGASSGEPEPDPEPKPAGPTADFVFTCSDLSCASADYSTPGDAAITSWGWTLGDGTTTTGTQVGHTYDEDGTYIVTLTVTDENGETDSTSTQVSVTAPEDDDPDPEPDPGSPGPASNSRSRPRSGA
jgi:PKD repeat protein